MATSRHGVRVVAGWVAWCCALCPDRADTTPGPDSSPSTPAFTPQELCANEKIAEGVQQEMEKSGRSDGLKGFEVLKRVHLDPDAWTTDNDLMTPSFKLKRAQLKKRYEKEIEAMYKALGE